MDALQYAQNFCKDIKKHSWEAKLTQNKTLNDMDGSSQTAYIYCITVLDTKRANAKVKFWLSFLLGTEGKVLKTILRDNLGRELEVLTDTVVEAYLEKRASAPINREYFSTMRTGM